MRSSGCIMAGTSLLPLRQGQGRPLRRGKIDEMPAISYSPEMTRPRRSEAPELVKGLAANQFSEQIFPLNHPAVNLYRARPAQVLRFRVADGQKARIELLAKMARHRELCAGLCGTIRTGEPSTWMGLPLGKGRLS